MARRDALSLRPKILLVAPRLLRALAGELEDLGTQGTGFDRGYRGRCLRSGNEEMLQRLAELRRVEPVKSNGASGKIKQGTYGLCEHCHTKIPVARLHALPYSTTCVKCQREMKPCPTGTNHAD